MSSVLKIPLLSLLILAGIIFGYSHYQKVKLNPDVVEDTSKIKKIEINSPAFVEKIIPIEHTCEGKDTIPRLIFGRAPKGTKSLALVVDDLDGTLGIFNHWLIWNIDPDTKKIEEGVVPPEATEGINGFGKIGWGGPCPPPGLIHHYRFRIYALKDVMDLDRDLVTPKSFQGSIKGSVIGMGEMIGIFGK